MRNGNLLSAMHGFWVVCLSSNIDEWQRSRGHEARLDRIVQDGVWDVAMVFFCFLYAPNEETNTVIVFRVVVFRMLILGILRLALAMMLSLMGMTVTVSTHRYSRVLVDLGYIARIKPAVQELFECTTDATGRISCLPHFRLLVCNASSVVSAKYIRTLRP